MIAIVGAKGGCGKTTTTLGLAEAFGRTGTTALAIDADRQLPNLHVMASVDRDPTLAALDDDGDATDVAQRSPRTSNAKIVPAPKPSEQVDLRTAFDRFDHESATFLVDCPSGAGPDVVEPLSAADAVIVVTTDAERSIVAAETTVDIARRLEVPVLGAVYNRCDSVPTEAEARLDVRTLGTVPDDPSPLSADAAREAYDEIVATLENVEYGSGPTVTYDQDLLSTGIDVLDHKLGGGLPAGSVVALTAGPASQSEHLLYELTDSRGTLYLSTERSAANVSRAIDASSVETGTPTVRHLDGEDPLEQASEIIRKLPDGANLVVDPIDELERADRDAYVEFLNEVTDRIAETEGLAVFHCLASQTEPENRTSTKHAVDAVFDFHTTAPGWDVDIKHYLSVSKFRFDSSFTETVELDSELANGPEHEANPTVLE